MRKIRFRRSSLFAVIAAAVIAYGYFSGSAPQESAGGRAVAPVAVPGQSSIEGPYFSDRDRVADRIIAAINHTQHTLDIAVYSITQPDVAAAIEAAHRRGVRVRIVTDAAQAFDRHSETGYLKSAGIPIRLSGGFRGARSLMHNKFAVFDGEVAETGSYNWTTSATSYNFENALFIRDAKLSARYEEEFEHLWAQAR
ncbi:MAG TPA: phospholipase D-like domain-containing protein [Terriglobia bacterium]|nr:phospholipase D-like domain-containing protein [Terriglobia bacterium]